MTAEPSPIAAKKWMGYMPNLTKEQMRQKWNDSLAESVIVHPFEPCINEQRKGRGYVFEIIGNTVIDVYPWRNHLYKSPQTKPE